MDGGTMPQIKLPTMDTTAIQRGLSDLGSAIQYQQDKAAAELERQRKIQASLEISQADLALKEQYNGMVNEFAQEPDISGFDWGQKYKEARGSAIDAAAGMISDPEIRAQYVAQQALNAEDHAQQFREIQAGKVKERNILITLQNFDAAATKGNADLEAGIDAVVTEIGPQIDAKGIVVGFKPGAVQAFGGPAQTFSALTSGQDNIAVNNTLTKIDAILASDKSTWAEKAAQVKELQKAQLQLIDNINAKGGGRRISSAAQDKVKQALEKADGEAQKNADIETKANLFSQLSQLETQAATDSANQAVWHGSYVATSIEKWLKDNPNVPTDVRDKANDMIAKYKVVPPDRSDEAAKREKDAKITQQQNYLFALSARGLTGQQLVDAVGQMYSPPKGYTGPVLEGGMSYAEAAKWAQSVDYLAKDPAVVSLAKEAKLPDDLMPAFAATIAGVREGGNSTFKTGNGQYDHDKVIKLANTMVEARKADFVTEILKQAGNPTVADRSETVTMLGKLNSGAGVTLFEGKDLTETNPTIAPFLADIRKAFAEANTGFKAVGVQFEQGEKKGLPILVANNGSRWRPIPNGSGGISFETIARETKK